MMTLAQLTHMYLDYEALSKEPQVVVNGEARSVPRMSDEEVSLICAYRTRQGEPIVNREALFSIAAVTLGTGTCIDLGHVPGVGSAKNT